ncbi:MAG TPA: thiamine pyrophosphate-dependent enzyme, partial [Marinobacter sp.]|nr:thiamine pyrophosphate-dependent enzyme [Marinobacter sp.]
VWREKDPILRMRLWLEGKKWWAEQDEKALQESLRKEVLETMKRAQKRPPPALDTLITDVYSDVTPALADQLVGLKAHIRRYPDEYPKSAQHATDTQTNANREA